MGSRGASSSANLQAIIAGLIIALIAAILWKGAIKPADITFPAANEITFSRLCTVMAIMFWGLWELRRLRICRLNLKILNVIFRAH